MRKRSRKEVEIRKYVNKGSMTKNPELQERQYQATEKEGGS